MCGVIIISAKQYFKQEDKIQNIITGHAGNCQLCLESHHVMISVWILKEEKSFEYLNIDVCTVYAVSLVVSLSGSLHVVMVTFCLLSLPVSVCKKIIPHTHTHVCRFIPVPEGQRTHHFSIGYSFNCQLVRKLAFC